MTDTPKAECGPKLPTNCFCGISMREVDDKWDALGVSYCTIHKAAPELLDVCKAMADVCSRLLVTEGLHSDCILPLQQMLEVIKKAEPREGK